MARANKIPTGEVIQSVLAAYERRQNLDALRRAESFAPLKEWAGVNECVLAARIAANAGSRSNRAARSSAAAFV